MSSMDGTLIESWYSYEEMARQGEYGEIVSSDGQIALSPGLEVMADFFISQLGGCSLVVDVGCGLGFPALILAPHVDYLVAFDAAPTMVRRLRMHIQRLRYVNIGVVRARAEALPFRGKRFDGASICGTLGSLSEPERMLEELHGIMRPGGIVACAAENFADKLVVDAGKKFRWFRMDEGQLSLQVIEYLQHPYRIRDYRYAIRNDSDLYAKLVAEHQGELSWRASTERGPADLPHGTVASVLYDEAIEYDPNTLTAAFERAGFQKQSVELCHHFRVECIFASFRRRG